VPLDAYLVSLVQLIVAPFHHLGAVWLGIVPLYVSLVLGELYKSKISFGHAVGNGFVMLWAGLNWALRLHLLHVWKYLTSPSSMRIAWLVTASCIALGVFTIVLGLRKKDKALCGILGHTRFSCYFLILLYPMQAQLPQMEWRWSYLEAILIFALPAWFVIYLAGRLMRTCVR
jgi:hypothetical protein